MASWVLLGSSSAEMRGTARLSTVRSMGAELARKREYAQSRSNRAAWPSGLQPLPSAIAVRGSQGISGSPSRCTEEQQVLHQEALRVHRQVGRREQETEGDHKHDAHAETTDNRY